MTLGSDANFQRDLVLGKIGNIEERIGKFAEEEPTDEEIALLIADAGSAILNTLIYIGDCIRAAGLSASRGR